MCKMIGKGRCNHIVHQNNNKEVKSYVEKIDNETTSNVSALATAVDEENVGRGKCNHIAH